MAMVRFAAVALMAGLVAGAARAEEDKPPPGKPKVGEECTLADKASPFFDGPVPITYLAADDEAWDKLCDAEEKGNAPLLAQLVATGKVFAVPNGTRARVVDYEDGSYQVFIPKGPTKGRSGIIEDRSVFKLKAAPGRRKGAAAPAGDADHDADADPPPARDEPEAPGTKAPKAGPPGVDPSARAAGLLRAAKALEQAGKPGPALASYRDLVAKYPDAPAARTARERIGALTAAEK